MSRAVSPEDYQEIHDLYSTYNQCSDDGDAEGYAACFAEDGALDGKQYVKGRQALIDYKRQEAGARRELYRRHWNGNLLLERRDDGEIVSTCYLLAFIGVPGHLPSLTHSGVYTDKLVKRDGRWVFALRKLDYDGNTTSKPVAEPST